MRRCIYIFVAFLALTSLAESVLGQKKQACATFAEVNKKFANEAAVRNTSIKEMQRAGCS